MGKEELRVGSERFFFSFIMDALALGVVVSHIRVTV